MPVPISTFDGTSFKESLKIGNYFLNVVVRRNLTIKFFERRQQLAECGHIRIHAMQAQRITLRPKQACMEQEEYCNKKRESAHSSALFKNTKP